MARPRTRPHARLRAGTTPFFFRRPRRWSSSPLLVSLPSLLSPLRPSLPRAATSRALGHLQRSAGIMQQMNALIKLPELGKSLQELAKEMMKAGVITEMVDDALSSALDSEDLESETELQVDQVLAELAVETAVAMPAAGSKARRNCATTEGSTRHAVAARCGPPLRAPLKGLCFVIQMSLRSGPCSADARAAAGGGGGRAAAAGRGRGIRLAAGAPRSPPARAGKRLCQSPLLRLFSCALQLSTRTRCRVLVLSLFLCGESSPVLRSLRLGWMRSGRLKSARGKQGASGQAALTAPKNEGKKNTVISS